MENITVNVFDDVLYLAWEFVYLIFFTRFVCVHGNYKNACAILISIYYSCLLYTSPSPRDRG